MPRRPQAKETSTEALRREILIADALCKREEAAISDAETLDSDYEPSSSSEDDSYESDFIDDSDIPPDEIYQVPKRVKFSAKNKNIR